jgi:hypothetical protein
VGSQPIPLQEFYTHALAGRPNSRGKPKATSYDSAAIPTSHQGWPAVCTLAEIEVGIGPLAQQRGWSDLLHNALFRPTLLHHFERRFRPAGVIPRWTADFFTAALARPCAAFFCAAFFPAQYKRIATICRCLPSLWPLTWLASVLGFRPVGRFRFTVASVPTARNAAMALEIASFWCSSCEIMLSI